MFSIIMPMDTNRLEQFRKTKEVYDEMPQVKEFIIPTRSELQIGRYLDDNKLMKDVKIVPYKHSLGFNPSKAFNVGVRNAQYNNIIITSPEVKPTTDVLEQLSMLLDKNIVCSVDDQHEDGNLSVLVSTIFRGETPAMYFLAMYRKEDIEKINGWDEDFMKGYAYEDNDFGDRWVRANLPFEVHDEIKATHQYHERLETIPGGSNTNAIKHYENTENNVTYCTNGLIKTLNSVQST